MAFMSGFFRGESFGDETKKKVEWDYLVAAKH